MRIVFDLQGIQGRSGNRGIGRYSFEMLKELCGSLQDNSLFFVTNNLLNLNDRRRDELQSLFPAAVWVDLDYAVENEGFSKKLEEFAVEMRKNIIDTLAPDWVHVCSVVEGFAEPVVGHSFGNYISTCFFYDAIPAIYSDKFLPTPEISEWYWNKASTYRGYDAIFAISSIAKLEGIDYLNIDEDVIHEIWGGLNAEHFEDLLSIKSKNIIYVGSFEERKNIARLIQAFAKALPFIEDGCELLLVGEYHGDEREIIQRVIQQSGVGSRVTITGYISDIELNKLFSRTKLLVLPSLHEGLGLPLLEAMAKGIPAIASGVSSMDVILQGLENRFDPLSVESMSIKIIEFMNDEDSRNRIREAFANRRDDYLWEKASQKVLTIISSLVDSQTNSEEFNKAKVRAIIDLWITKAASSKLDDAEKRALERVFANNFETLNSIAPIAKLSEAPKYTFTGHFSGSYSLSQLNRNVYLASQSLGLDSYFFPETFEPNSDSFKHETDFNVKDFEIGSVDPERQLLKKIVWLRNTYPPIANDMRAEINIFHTFNWEETEFPQRYIAEFNHFLDGITFASEFVQKTLIDNGLALPSTVVGASSVFSHDQLQKGRPVRQREKFNFLHISSGFPRKGIDLLLEAYGQAFKKSDSVQLVIKTFPNPHNNTSKLLQDFREKYPNHSDVIHIDDDLTTGELLALYSNADCLVQPSKGEGFGLPIYEALTLNIPVIATNWGGHKDFLSSKSGVLIDYELSPSRSHLRGYESLWAEPKIPDLVDSMRKMVLDPIKVKFLGESWESNLIKHEKFIQKLSGYRIQSPKIAWVTTFNTKCGIAEYSKGLLEYFPSKNTRIFPPASGEPVNLSLESKYRRVWIERGRLGNLEKEIKEFEANVVIIQHNWGFYDPAEFNSLIFNLSQTTSVIVEMHALRNVSLAVYPGLKEILTGLHEATRVVVHDTKDLNLLKSYGIVKNAMLLPLAFPNPVNKFKYNLANLEEIVIGTSGFALPNKNQEILFQVAQSLLHKFKKVTLLFFCPMHTDPSSVSQIEFLQELAQKYTDIHFRIETSFLSGEEVLNSLYKCDVLVYAYKESGETASAAVRDGISSGVPVVVTPSPIFDSTRDLVFTAKNYSAKSLAERIVEISNFLAEPEVAERYGIEVQKTVMNNSRSNISRRIQGMSQGLINKFNV